MKLHVLEMLLRLRQVACHAGLVDEKLAATPSGKLEVLADEIDEVIASGHKALVFSQFVSLLSLVRRDLDARSIPYAYLDGSTRDREAEVRRFQEDPSTRLFLVSLLAGGHGLNLTAADYVIILDPWWNPAVEAQAIGRAHRIGRAATVVALRLVSRDTVEEKILELQESKRDLAGKLLAGEASEGAMRELTVEDLMLLLS
jgi:SNF2 family DNA or RNA helicase